MAKQLSHSTCNAKMKGYADGGKVLSDSFPIAEQLGSKNVPGGVRTHAASKAESDQKAIFPAPQTLDEKDIEMDSPRYNFKKVM